MENERLTLTIEEAAKILGISRNLCYDRVKTGGIPVIKIGRRFLVPRKALMKLLEKGQETVKYEATPGHAEQRREMEEKPSNSETEIIETPESISVKEAGRRGGTATRDRYAGTGFYQQIGAKGGKRQKELYSDLLAEFGRRGGRPQRPNLEPSWGEESPQKKEDTVGLGDSSQP